ncbi:phosphate starvation-inducible protein PhoH [Vagococcus bubulae]|uniref:PhoH-like protein n=2 Tax=Vagococcus bubulae TaxID=1977868 RepID=A0A429ZRS4_9ENTE|nr:PhoH family protein [Vagococcus bubulae]RST96383.1 phosphate starvation-inducible protein PhoH [Vagococcus bubulae]
MLDKNIESKDLFGTHDKHVKMLEEYLNVSISSRGEVVHLSGSAENVSMVQDILTAIQQLILRGHNITSSDMLTAIQLAKKGQLETFFSLYEHALLKDNKGNAIRVKNDGQKKYIQAIKKNDVTFGIGPAGTGKTFLAVVMAVSALKKGEVEKIILTRPAVEAGENLGFLPGDLQEKVNPYLRPVYDALYQILGMEHTTRLMDRGVIEIAPLAYMRGRTLEEAFVILDEAQNTTNAQMKMFLTRLGNRSKMIINGDKTQIDLPRGVESGLVHAEKILRDIKKIAFIEFSTQDVVRHPVVADIIKAYADN